ncbi:MAG TPA: SAM-dependent chlorinase/fluorinase, partial [Tenuifilaceae bacterium]|nr:SAM-dependent chlorinase/fluorinase [Tenuifilaceae bacterium]
RFTIYVQSFNYRIDEIVKTYSDVEEGELLALFNTLNLLEVALNNGFAAEMHALQVGSSIMVKFHDN